mgnify:CR=1 FL=1
MPTPLEQSILRTATWFSLFETPVTVFELWKWMLDSDRAYTLEETYQALEGAWLRERLSESDGTWTIRPSETPTPGVGVSDGFVGVLGSEATKKHQPPGLVFGRREKFLDATRKYQKLRWAMWYVRCVPGIRAVAAGNTLAWWNTRPDSDIDLLVVTRPGMIWLARLLVVTPFALLGKRPGASAVDPFCFSFFVTTDALDFSSLRLDGGDPYLAYWTCSLVPVYDRGGIFDRIVAENGWTGESLKHVGTARRSSPSDRSLAEHPPSRGPSRVATALERIAGAAQFRRFPAKIRSLMNADSRVVVSDQMLKFHENDRRSDYRERLNRLCASPSVASPTSSSS